VEAAGTINQFRHRMLTGRVAIGRKQRREILAWRLAVNRGRKWRFKMHTVTAGVLFAQNGNLVSINFDNASMLDARGISGVPQPINYSLS